MEKEKRRMWRRMQTKRKWYNRVHEAYYYLGYNTRSSFGKRSYETWRELLEDKWFKAFKTLARRCQCYCCQDEKYNRARYSRETRKIIKEEFME